MRFFLIACALCAGLLLSPSAIYSTPLMIEGPQDPGTRALAGILAGEHNIAYLKQIGELLERIDSTYTNLYEKLSSGGQIVVFFDPAHGKWPGGRWEGEVTGRISCTGIPEELYSIPISRELYRLLSANRFIRVVSTEDFMAVLKGRRDVYMNISFPETVRRAGEEGAFIVVAEHLNNTSRFLKASELVNLTGIHITSDRRGNRYLSYFADAHKGFLTLYNKFDVTDFSRRYALRLKENLAGKGMKANSWHFGAVPDDRFCYFVDFPISVIYESGFISNPEDEAFLSDPENQRMIAGAQYESLMDTMKDVFGVDISGREAKRRGDPRGDILSLLKLSRIAIFYIHACEPGKATAVIREMESLYGKTHAEILSPYRELKHSLARAEHYFTVSKRFVAAKNYKKSARYMRLARRALRFKPVFSSMYKKYTGDYARLGVPQDTDIQTPAKKTEPVRPAFKAAGLLPTKAAPLSTPVILAVEDAKNLEDAVVKALDPDKETLEKIVSSLKRTGVSKRVRVGRSWRTTKEKLDFTTGIYIVSINKHLNVTSAFRVGRVMLDPRKYQNQQYLKNSYFAFKDKQRSL